MNGWKRVWESVCKKRSRVRRWYHLLVLGVGGVGIDAAVLVDFSMVID